MERDDWEKNDRDLVLARDELVFAERAVAELEGERAERLAEVEGLDATFVAAWTRLTGTREARIEAAVNAVGEVDRRLARAREALEATRARVEGVRAAHEARERGEAQRAAEAAARADAVAASDTPDGDRLRRLRMERALLQERHAVVEAAALAGSDLLATLTTVAHASGDVADRTRDGAWMGIGGYGGLRALENELAKAGAYAFARQGLAAYPERAERFRAALAELGHAYEPAALTGSGTVSPLASLLANGLLVDLVLLLEADTQRERFADLGSTVRQLLVPVDVERRALAERIDALRADEAALVDRASRSP